MTDTNAETKTAARNGPYSHQAPAWLLADNGDNKSGQYLVDLELFHGPMELLLYLIKKDELDLNDIPIARITNQYLEYVELIKDLNLEAAGEFVLMAATLIRIKAKLLLPREEVEGEEIDPREELVMALLEYKRFKEAGEQLRELRQREEELFVPERKPLRFSTVNSSLPGNTLFQLIEALKNALERVKESNDRVATPEQVHIEDRVRHIVEFLTENESATFTELFADAQSKLFVIVTFIAILEMVNRRRLKVRQSVAFAELRVYRGDEFFSDEEIIVDEWEGANYENNSAQEALPLDEERAPLTDEADETGEVDEVDVANGATQEADTVAPEPVSAQ